MAVSQDTHIGRLIVEDMPRPGWFNMAADYYLAAVHDFTGYKLAARFYTWSPPTISLGIHQTHADIDLDLCRENGWDIVHRPTGGRALLHKYDLSYAIIIPLDQDRVQSLNDLYKSTGNVIVDALKSLKINAKLSEDVKTTNKFNQLRTAKLCFDTQAHGEVSVDNKKIAGCAQHLYKSTVLQHGSILLDGDPAEIVEALKIDPPLKVNLHQKIEGKAVSLSSLTGYTLSAIELSNCLIPELEGEWELTFERSAWTDDEIEQINSLRNQFEISSQQDVVQVNRLEYVH